MRDAFAHRDDAGAACHDAIIEALEDVLFAEALVPTRHEGNAGKSRGHISAPGAGASEGVDRVASAFARQPVQQAGVAQDHKRIVGGSIERHEFAAGGGHVGDQPAGARCDDGMVTGARKDTYQFERAGIGGAAIQRRHDNQRGDWIARGKTRHFVTPSNRQASRASSEV